MLIASIRFVLGLIVGSFLAALSYRLPLGVSIKKGRSFCPNCKHLIRWFDNVPVVSYLLLHGKCRDCKKKISVRYPLIELSTAIIFVLIGNNIFLLFISCILITIFIIDWEQMLIPDELVFWGLAVALLYTLFFTPNSLFADLLAGFIWANLLLAIYFLTGGRGMGLGDVKLALLLGSVLGITLLPYGILASFLTGGAVAGILLVLGKAKLKQKIAFGPFMVAGFFVVLWLVK